ncbi:MAG: DUF1822 family protein [Cyanobacteria bacterium RU_5_0]|nr:DUF1822 family protein [Cyanobacteria bacterium RU_5_0]
MSNIFNLEFALPLPITRNALRLADQFARQQPTVQKADQVRRNTIAVCVMNDYLQLMGISTDLSVGDSWNPVVRLCADVADLEVAGVGRLECRPLSEQPASQVCAIPPEVWEDRIGYVVVQIDESSQAAALLGFVERAAVEELPLSQLQSPELLIHHLDRLLYPVSPVALPPIARPVRVNFRQWLQNTFEAGWQTAESLLNPPVFAYGFRSAETVLEPANEIIRRAKLIDLGIQTADRTLVLVVELMPEAILQTVVRLQVHPSGNQLYLPAQVRLTVLDEAGVTFLEAESREADNYIQLQFRGSPGERFSVQITLDDASLMEEFVI